MSRTSRPLPEIPGQSKKQLPPLPARPRKSFGAPEDYQDYEPAQKFLCTGKVPQSLQGIRKSMILKMADSFGIDAGDRTIDNLCQLVDNAIKKTATMSEINLVSRDCVERLSLVRQNLSSKHEIGRKITERLGGEIEELENLLDLAQRDYNDRNVPDSQLRKYLARFRTCSQDTERITLKIEQYAREMSGSSSEIQRPPPPKQKAPRRAEKKTRAAQIQRDISDSSSESPTKRKKFSFQDALDYAGQGITFGKGVYDTFRK